MWRKYIKVSVFAIGILSGSTVVAADFDANRYRVQIIAADEGEGTKRIADALHKQFPAAQDGNPEAGPAERKKNSVYLSIGPAALRSVLAQPVNGYVVSLFTSSQAYKDIMEKAPESQRAKVTAIYAEPAPIDQLRLIAAIYRKRVTVAVLLSEKNAYLLPALRRAAAQTNIELLIEHVVDSDGLNRSLDRVATGSVLLALPDTTIYNPENVRNILITTYRRGQLVVGFSAAFVKAGSVATTYSSIEDIVAQTEEVVAEISASERPPEPQFPKYFDVLVNESVARSLNVVIDEGVRSLSRKPGAR